MKTIKQIKDINIQKAIEAELLARSRDKSESTNPKTTLENSSPKNAPGSVPLANAWQQRRLNLDARPPLIQEMADQTEAWCRNFAVYGKEKRIIVLAGTFGCGKSHCFRAAHRYVNDVRMEVWPRYWPKASEVFACNWADFSRDVLNRTPKDEGDGIRTDMLSADVAFIDDIGSEEDPFRSGAATRLLADVLSHLHDRRRFAFITTNISPGGWRERWDGRTADRLARMDARIMDLTECESYASWKMKQEV